MTKPTRGRTPARKSASPRSRPSARQRSPSGESLPHEWLEFLACLRSRGVRFLIVGGHALAAHGRPRFTEDLDVFVEPTRANAVRVCAALGDFGFPALAGEVDAFASPDRMATLGRVPLRIDVMNEHLGRRVPGGLARPHGDRARRCRRRVPRRGRAAQEQARVGKTDRSRRPRLARRGPAAALTRRDAPRRGTAITALRPTAPATRRWLPGSRRASPTRRAPPRR